MASTRPLRLLGCFRLAGWLLIVSVVLLGFLYHRFVWRSPAPLFRACALNDIVGVRKYVERGIDLNSQEKWGWHLELRGNTPLTTAVDHADGEIILCLIRAGALINFCDGIGRTPAFHAASRGDPQIIALLAGNGADFSQACSGVSPLEEALACGHLEAAGAIRKVLLR